MPGRVYRAGISCRRFAGAFSREKREDVDLCWQQGCGYILKHAPPASGTQNEGYIRALEIEILRYSYSFRSVADLAIFAKARASTSESLLKRDSRGRLIFERPGKPRSFAELAVFLRRMWRGALKGKKEPKLAFGVAFRAASSGINAV